VLDVSLELAALVHTGDVGAGFSATVTPARTGDLVILATSIAGTVATAWVAGGVEGQDYQLAWQAAMKSGRVLSGNAFILARATTPLAPAASAPPANPVPATPAASLLGNPLSTTAGAQPVLVGPGLAMVNGALTSTVSADVQALTAGQAANAAATQQAIALATAALAGTGGGPAVAVVANTAIGPDHANTTLVSQCPLTISISSDIPAGTALRCQVAAEGGDVILGSGFLDDPNAVRIPAGGAATIIAYSTGTASGVVVGDKAAARLVASIGGDLGETDTASSFAAGADYSTLSPNLGTVASADYALAAVPPALDPMCAGGDFGISQYPQGGTATADYAAGIFMSGLVERVPTPSFFSRTAAFAPSSYIPPFQSRSYAPAPRPTAFSGAPANPLPRFALGSTVRARVASISADYGLQLLWVDSRPFVFASPGASSQLGSFILGQSRFA
jgi:hypothetical protein